jgi:EmrB/QacA subfamily drug resistance transporter
LNAPSETGSPRVPLGATLARREKLILLNVLVLCLFLTALDQSIVATAIPHVLADLGGFNLLAWVITVYLLTSTVTIPIAGKLSDMFGRKHFLLAGVGLFVASSAACGGAPSMAFLIGARAVQGVGAGLITACVFGTMGDLLTPIERAKYFALTVGGFTFASVAGPTLGGFFADGPGWRWCFYVNLPLGVLAAIFIVLRLPAGRGAGGRISEIDFVGAALLGAATVCFLMAIVWASVQFGWLGSPTLGLLVATLALVAAFVWQERQHTYAIIPLDLFRNLSFTQAIAITVVQAAGVMAATQFLPTFVQTSLHGSATASGLLVMPQAVGALVSSIVCGQLMSRAGRTRNQMVAGACIMAAAAFLLLHLHTGEPEWHVAAFLVVLGLGSGLIFPVTQVVVQSAVSQDRQGIAASTRQFFNQIAQTMGVGVFGLVLTTVYATAFTQNSTSFAAALPASTYNSLKDPTLALDPTKFSQLSNDVTSLPGGTQILAEATRAQRESVATATDRIYTFVFAATLVLLVITLLFREIPLRRTFEIEEG